MANTERVEHDLSRLKADQDRPPTDYELWCLRELVQTDHNKAIATIWSPPNPFAGKDVGACIRQIIADAVETDLIAKTGTYPVGKEDFEEHDLREAPEDWQQEFIQTQKRQLETTLGLTDRGLVEYMVRGECINFRITPEGAARLPGIYKLVVEKFTQQFWEGDLSGISESL